MLSKKERQKLLDLKKELNRNRYRGASMFGAPGVNEEERRIQAEINRLERKMNADD